MPSKSILTRTRAGKKIKGTNSINNKTDKTAVSAARLRNSRLLKLCKLMDSFSFESSRLCGLFQSYPYCWFWLGGCYISLLQILRDFNCLHFDNLHGDSPWTCTLWEFTSFTVASATAADNLLLCPPIYQLWQVSIMGVIIKITLVLQLTNLHKCTLLKATSY